MVLINDVNTIDNISICIDQYEDFCSESILTNISKKEKPHFFVNFLSQIFEEYYSSYNWIFIVVSSIIIITILILSSFCIFYLISNHKQKETKLNNTINQKPIISTSNLNKYKIRISYMYTMKIFSFCYSSTNYFSNITYPELQQISTNYSKQNSLSLTNIDQLSKENQSSLNLNYNIPFHENTYSTSLTDSQINKKTVFEVVV